MSLALQHSPSRILRELLVNVGAAGDPAKKQAWPVFDGSEPNEPDNCVTVYDTEGQQDGRSMVDGEIWEHPGVQVRVRSTDKPTGTVRSWELRRRMAESVYGARLTLDGATYIVWAISKIKPVLYIGRDLPRSNRYLFTINALMSIDRTA